MSQSLSSSGFVIASSRLEGLKPKSNLYRDVLTSPERPLLKYHYNKGNTSSQLESGYSKVQKQIAISIVWFFHSTNLSTCRQYAIVINNYMPNYFHIPFYNDEVNLQSLLEMIAIGTPQLERSKCCKSKRPQSLAIYIECPRRRRVCFDDLQETISRVLYSGLFSNYYGVPATLTTGRPTMKSIAITLIRSVLLGRTSQQFPIGS